MFVNSIKKLNENDVNKYHPKSLSFTNLYVPMLIDKNVKKYSDSFVDFASGS